jgi:hypothetical protein
VDDSGKRVSWTKGRISSSFSICKQTRHAHTHIHQSLNYILPFLFFVKKNLKLISLKYLKNKLKISEYFLIWFSVTKNGIKYANMIIKTFPWGKIGRSTNIRFELQTLKKNPSPPIYGPYNNLHNCIWF